MLKKSIADVDDQSTYRFLQEGDMFHVFSELCPIEDVDISPKLPKFKFDYEMFRLPTPFETSGPDNYYGNDKEGDARRAAI